MGLSTLPVRRIPIVPKRPEAPFTDGTTGEEETYRRPRSAPELRNRYFSPSGRSPLIEGATPRGAARRGRRSTGRSGPSSPPRVGRYPSTHRWNARAPNDTHITVRTARSARTETAPTMMSWTRVNPRAQNPKNRRVPASQAIGAMIEAATRHNAARKVHPTGKLASSSYFHHRPVIVVSIDPPVIGRAHWECVPNVTLSGRFPTLGGDHDFAREAVPWVALLLPLLPGAGGLSSTTLAREQVRR